MADSAIITSLCWVSRGYAKPVLDDFEPSQEQLKTFENVKKTLKGKIEGKDYKELTNELQEHMESMNLDGYDEEDNAPIFTPELKMLKKSDKAMQDEDEEFDEEGSSESVSSFGEEGEAGGKKGTRDNYPDVLEDSEEEKEDYTIRKSDALIVAATAENDHSNLEIYIYDHKTSDLYVHHELILSSYPLCLEWMGSLGGNKRNLIIVGTFLPEIEVWDLDKEDCEPLFTLGGLKDGETQGKKKKSKMVTKFNKDQQQQQFDQNSHTDAVMSLSLNPFQSEYLASGSADTTVRIWDLEEAACKASFTQLHKNKVQVVRWNKRNEQVLLTGGYDRVLNVVDVRDSNSTLKFRLKKELKDLETAQWHPFSEHNFIISTESGIVQGYDTRNSKESAFSFQAHEKSCTSVTFSPHIPTLLATCSLDEYVKIWDISTQTLIGHKKMNTIGELFTLSFYQDLPWVLAAGGSKGEIVVWDIEENEKVSQHFKDKLDKSSVVEKIEEDEEEELDDDEESEEEKKEVKKKLKVKSKKAAGGKVDKKQKKKTQ